MTTEMKMIKTSLRSNLVEQGDVPLKDALILICLLLTFGVWGQTKAKKIPYTLAHNYFVSNKIPDGELVFPKITTKEEFNKIFGMSAVMGKDGKPSPIDFSKQFVIGVTDIISNNTENFSPRGLTENHGTLTFSYEKKIENDERSYTSRSCIILILDKKYVKNEIKIVKWTREEMIPFIIGKHYFVKNTVKEGLIELPKITTEEEFQKYFGMAAVMGKEGKPNSIDFSEQFVVAIINHSTKDWAKMTVKSLTKKGHVSTLKYHIGNNDPGSGYRSCLLLVLDKKYMGKINFVEQ